MSDLRLYLFECGTLKCKLHNIKMNQGLNEPYEIPVPWFFIQHPKGNIVIDGGNALECANNPHRPTRGVRVRLHSRLVCGRRLCPARFRSTGPALAFPRGPCTDNYDLFGDGSVKMIFTPGHSPGHQSFLITLPITGSIILTIDAAYTLDHWDEKALPGFLASTVDTVRSVRKLHQVARQTGAMVVTGHDPDAWPKFKKAPDYYD